MSDTPDATTPPLPPSQQDRTPIRRTPVLWITLRPVKPAKQPGVAIWDFFTLMYLDQSVGGVLGVSLFWVWVSLFWVCVQLYGLGVWFCLSCWMVWSICWRALRIASWNSFVFIGVVVRRFASWLCRCSRRMRFLVLLGLFRRGRGFRRVWRLL